MNDDSLQDISDAKADLAETISRLGEEHIEVSYKLDKLAELLKANGQLLDAANTSAQAKALRQRLYKTESDQQSEKYGEASLDSKQPVSATGWLWLLYRIALGFSALVLVIAIFYHPQQGLVSGLFRELIGSSAAAVLIQFAIISNQNDSTPGEVNHRGNRCKFHLDARFR
jgi:predicted membrane-bound mannosyltransferase